MTTVSIATLFPGLYSSFLTTSLVKRAQESGAVNIELADMFSFVGPKKRIDGPIFGHGEGVVIKPDIVKSCVDSLESKHGKAYKIFFSPQGKKLDQDLLKKIALDSSKIGHIMLLPARYEGMDSRVEEYYSDMTISIGDFVLMGGDLPAMILMEGLLRLFSGVVGKELSVQEDSFSGPFVDYPSYTEPVTWQDLTVPEVLRSGNHGLVDAWRKDIAAEKTVKSHFQWLRTHVEDKQDIKLAKKFIPNHYVALMHSDVLVPAPEELDSENNKNNSKNNNRVTGDSSVTSIDIHDIARSAKTYGLSGYFVVTRLLDQQKIVNTLLDFWKTGSGVTYNASRHQAVKEVELAENLDSVIAKIESVENKKPVIIVTSAKDIGDGKKITYYDQEVVWALDRPVLFLLGTARGLSPQLVEKADFALLPIYGFSEFNHLSVRSAAAVIFDRWLGISRTKI